MCPTRRNLRGFVYRGGSSDASVKLGDVRLDAIETCPKVGIVTLNWNNWRDTIAMLESLFSGDASGVTVVLCDNGSTNDSIVRIRQWASSREDKEFAWTEMGADQIGRQELPLDAAFVLVRIPQNVGFSRGSNVGFEVLSTYWHGDYVFSLNNDTEVPATFVPDVITSMQNLPASAVVAGPLILDPDGADWQRPLRRRIGLWTWLLAGLLFRWVRARGKHNWVSAMLWWTGGSARSVYMLPGSCLFFRAAFLREIGGFDPEFFFYWEEAAVAEEVHRKGHTAWFVPSVRIKHAWSRSVGRGGEKHLVASTLLFFRKYRCFGRGRTVLVKLGLLFVLVSRGVQGRLESTFLGSVWTLIRA